MQQKRRGFLGAIAAGAGLGLTLPTSTGRASRGATDTAADDGTTALTFDNVGSSAWELTVDHGGGASVGDGDNPRLILEEIGTRYVVDNNGWSFHPIAFIDADDDLLLSQSGEGSFEDDDDVDWVDNGDQFEFTLTEDLAAELDRYRCTVHTVMNGDLEFVSDATIVSAAHNSRGTDGDALRIESARLADGGFVAIHDDRLADGNPIESIIGASGYLTAGTTENVVIPLDRSVTAEETLTARVYRDTDGDQSFDYAATDGSEDTPYTADGAPVADSATVVPVEYAAPTGGISLTAPADGTAVSPPVTFEMDTTDFVVEAATNGVTDGHGYLNLLIDQPTVQAGEIIPSGEGYYALADGQTSATISLTPGDHTIRLQASDANGAAYALTDERTVTVEPPTVIDRPVQDPDGDGVFEDINGDGTATVTDVQALFVNLDADVVQNNPAVFDFNGDGRVDIVDVQALFNQIR